MSGRMAHTAAIGAVALGLVGCGGRDHGGGGRDAGPPRDAGPRSDSGPRRDGGPGSDSGFHYCPGSTPGDEECRADGDCACGMCSTGPLCGGGCPAGCSSDGDCDGGICAGGCCPYCIPRCPTTACSEGSRCNDSTGRCDPIHCSEGMACPTNTRCTTGSPGTGCVRISCTADGDCDCGTCAEGQCWDRPGQCCPPLPG